MSASGSLTSIPAILRAAPASPAFHPPSASKTSRIDESLQDEVLQEDAELFKVSDVHQWLDGVPEPVEQGDVDSTPRSPPPIAPVEDEPAQGLPKTPRRPNQYFSDDGDDDDNWQPQTHGRDEPARKSKRKHQAMVVDENTDEDEDQVSDAPQPKKKAKVVKKPKELEEPTEAKPKRTPAPQKPKPYDATKELDRKANAEQVRLANAPNKHLKEMGTWDYVKVNKGGAAVQDRKANIEELHTDHANFLRHIKDLDPGRDLNGK